MFFFNFSYVPTRPGSSNSKGQVFEFGNTESFCKTVMEFLKPMGGISLQAVVNINNAGSLLAKIKTKINHDLLNFTCL